MKRLATSPSRAALATCASALSALVYFCSSDGIRGYLALLRKAGAALVKIWS